METRCRWSVVEKLHKRKPSNLNRSSCFFSRWQFVTNGMKDAVTIRDADKWLYTLSMCGSALLFYSEMIKICSARLETELMTELCCARSWFFVAIIWWQDQHGEEWKDCIEGFPFHSSEGCRSMETIVWPQKKRGSCDCVVLEMQPRAPSSPPRSSTNAICTMWDDDGFESLLCRDSCNFSFVADQPDVRHGLMSRLDDFGCHKNRENFPSAVSLRNRFRFNRLGTSEIYDSV